MHFSPRPSGLAIRIAPRSKSVGPFLPKAIPRDAAGSRTGQKCNFQQMRRMARTPILDQRAPPEGQYPYKIAADPRKSARSRAATRLIIVWRCKPDQPRTLPTKKYKIPPEAESALDTPQQNSILQQRLQHSIQIAGFIGARSNKYLRHVAGDYR